MRLLARSMIGLAGLIAVIVIAAVGARTMIVDAAIERAMANAGLQSPSVEIDAFTLSEIELSDIRAGGDAPDLSIEALKVEYSLFALLQERRLKRIDVGPGTIAVRIGDQGKASLAGLVLEAGEEASAAPTLALGALTIDRLTVEARTDAGVVSGVIDGAYDEKAGAAFDVSGGTRMFPIDDAVVEEAAFQAGVRLQPDGDVSVKGGVSGDIASPLGRIDDVVVAFDGEGASWRAVATDGMAALRGRLELQIASSDFSIANTAALSSLTAEEARLFATEPVRTLSARGGVILVVDDSGVSVEAAGDRALMIETNRGDQLVVGPIDGAPIFRATDLAARAQLAAAFTGPGVTGGATFAARSLDNGGVRFAATSDIVNPSFSGVAMGATAFAADGVFRDDALDGDIIISTTMQQAEIGRFSITDAPFRAALRMSADFNARTLSVTTETDDCIALSRATFALDGQPMDATLRNASLCEKSGPLLTAEWDGDPEARLVGMLAAESGRYRWGETRLAGAPPWIDVDAVYRPAAHTTRVVGSVSGGRATLNEALVGSNISGVYEARLDGAEISGEATLKRARIAQAAEIEQVAPVIVSGDAVLSDGEMTMSFDVATPAGVAIGDGRARHAVVSGRGEAEFASRDLTFAPNGLQPDALLPVLKGFIGAASGGAAASSTFAWGASPDDFKSSARVTLDGLTFRGPGVAVSQTTGLTGELVLDSLTPLRSAGPQAIRVEMIEIGALILENGDVEFEFPGDDTLQVVKAEFPWFGGVIGAYDSAASLAGETATTVLSAKDVDLAQLLAFLEVEGLSGEGVVEGELPLVVENGRARIDGGRMASVGPGVVRYKSEATDAAGAANEQAALAFRILEDLKFDSLSAGIDGPLDGTLVFSFVFEGANAIPLNDPRVTNDVVAPVIFRINLEAPLLSLLQSARASSNASVLIERATGVKIEGVVVDP
ncbi:MAG: YdbH domain-containing protein [Pseudomonadota bacterium]